MEIKKLSKHFNQHSAIMDLDQFDLSPDPDCDDSTVSTAITPSETVSTDLRDDQDPLGGAVLQQLLVPWPGSTFIIRSVSCERVITLLDGQIVLAQPSNRGSIFWVCIETAGWLGFRNTVSGQFLGHDKKGKLCCASPKHNKWEYFCCRVKPKGGCVLLMTHWDEIWHVGIKVEQGVEKLAKIGDGKSDGIEWEFVKV